MLDGEEEEKKGPRRVLTSLWDASPEKRKARADIKFEGKARQAKSTCTNAPLKTREHEGDPGKAD